MAERRLRGKRDTISMVREDFAKQLDENGSTVIFRYRERIGGTYNEAYKVWEGGEYTEIEHETKGLGRILDFRENKMEYEFGRISVGDAVIRFSHDFPLENFLEKDNLRIYFNGQWWLLDSSINWFDYVADAKVSRAIRGYKAVN